MFFAIALRASRDGLSKSARSMVGIDVNEEGFSDILRYVASEPEWK